MSYTIETCNLTKMFPVIKDYHDLLLHPFRKKEVAALKNVNIQIKKGELTALLGPNGAGKTTLIKILCTLILPTSGQAFINGMDVTRESKNIRKKIGYVVSDERSFYWRLTGRQNLRFFAKLNNIGNHEADSKITRLLEFMDFTDAADRMFKDYSTGMRQKLAIARGLLTDPEVIFMDEPTRSLDQSTAMHLRKLIRETLVDDYKRTIIFATHNLKEAEEICDTIAIINKGEIQKTGQIEKMKMEFDYDKKYIIGLKSSDEHLIKKIRDIESIKEITCISERSLPCSAKYEVQIPGDNRVVSQAIKDILGMGSNITFFYEKKTSLEELYSAIIDS